MEDEMKASVEVPDNISNSLDRLTKVTNEMHELVYPQQENVRQDSPMPNSKVDSIRIVIDANIEKLHEVRNSLRKL
jgi:hypothetical protein